MDSKFQNKSGIFTGEEIDTLIKKDRVILLYENQVIDVTDYKHPGGQDFFTDNIRKDIKKLFIDQDHSPFAKSLIERYRIGYISSDGVMDQESELYQIHQSLAKKIDLKKPLLPQVVKLTKKEYLAMIERPMVLEDEDCIQLHPNKIYDWIFYKTYIHLNQAVLIPFVIYFLYTTLLNKEINLNIILSLILSFILGFCIWTVFEYFGHRYFLHGNEKLSENPTEEELFKAFRKHQCHHAFINQKNRMPSNLYKVFMGASFIWITLIWFGYDLATRVTCGMVIGQLIYDSIHHYIHFSGHKKTWPWLQRLKDQHMRHHYRHRTMEFGVTNGFWDYVFDTAI